MVESIYCPPETQNILNNLYSNTKKIFLIKYVFWGCRRRTSILCRKNKQQESEGKKQGERRTMDTLFSFLNNYNEVWLIFSVVLSSAAQQCDSVIHIKNIYSFSYSFSCGL